MPSSGGSAYPEAWMRNFDPGDPQGYMRGWRNLMQSRGINPYGNNPYAQWLDNPNLVVPLVSNWLVNQALTGQNPSTPADMYAGLRSFMQNPFQATVGGYGTDVLGLLKDAVMQYLDPAAKAPEGMLGYLANTLLSDDDAAARILAGIQGRNLTPAMQRPLYARMMMQRQMYGDQGDPGANSFAEWFFRNQYR